MRFFPASISQLVLIAWSNSSFIFLLDTAEMKGVLETAKKVRMCHQYEYLRFHEYQY